MILDTKTKRKGFWKIAFFFLSSFFVEFFNLLTEYNEIFRHTRKTPQMNMTAFFIMGIILICLINSFYIENIWFIYFLQWVAKLLYSLCFRWSNKISYYWQYTYKNFTLKITRKTSKLCIKQPQDEQFLSIFEEDIVKHVQTKKAWKLQKF